MPLCCAFFLFVVGACSGSSICFAAFEAPAALSLTTCSWATEPLQEPSPLRYSKRVLCSNPHPVPLCTCSPDPPLTAVGASWERGWAFQAGIWADLPRGQAECVTREGREPVASARLLSCPPVPCPSCSVCFCDRIEEVSCPVSPVSGSFCPS